MKENEENLSDHDKGSNTPEPRDPKTGRFLPGYKGGHGNPHAAKYAELKQALIDAIGPDDITEVMLGLLKSAKGGNTYAAREITDRYFGKARQSVDIFHTGKSIEDVIADMEAQVVAAKDAKTPDKPAQD